ncbi:hypothetical protein BU26DRAFT_83308 [Trematosphaeria pertusa]|uniref:Uncharacterized protein n=1 Tax=Trematosphaeria pertusa TaxID=390896 RepID=A0A6A6I3X7_9PLEO|nr:uncharacterized protein BU26DRAFT_83308 [Trematosphaeria pertusa]KAF2244642.1 hypothetical protein BU26DRAFT_83308 [Trematosphaeria pertusa]
MLVGNKVLLFRGVPNRSKKLSCAGLDKTIVSRQTVLQQALFRCITLTIIHTDQGNGLIRTHRYLLTRHRTRNQPSPEPLAVAHPAPNTSQLLFSTSFHRRRMCYALLQTCTQCSWLLQITYPRCSHAKTHGLDPPACPNRMKRKYTDGGLCRWCRVRKGSLSGMPWEERKESSGEERQDGAMGPNIRRKRKASCVEDGEERHEESEEESECGGEYVDEVERKRNCRGETMETRCVPRLRTTLPLRPKKARH